MRNTNLKSMAVVLGILVVLASLFSFAPTPGGDHFAITMNKRTIVEQWIHRDKQVQTVSLTESNINDEMAVIFTHCGVIGTSRNLEIRDSKHNTVKLWHFPDAVETSGNMMTVRVKDILALKKNGETKFQLFYSAKELNKGMTLANLNVTSDAKASLK